MDYRIIQVREWAKGKGFCKNSTKFSDCPEIRLPFLAATTFWKCSFEDNFQSVSSNIKNIIHFYTNLTLLGFGFTQHRCQWRVVAIWIPQGIFWTFFKTGFIPQTSHVLKPRRSISDAKLIAASKWYGSCVSQLATHHVSSIYIPIPASNRTPHTSI